MCLGGLSLSVLVALPAGCDRTHGNETMREGIDHHSESFDRAHAEESHERIVYQFRRCATAGRAGDRTHRCARPIVFTNVGTRGRGSIKPNLRQPARSNHVVGSAISGSPRETGDHVETRTGADQPVNSLAEE